MPKEKKNIYKYNENMNFEVVDGDWTTTISSREDSREVNFLCAEHNCRVVVKKLIGLEYKLTCPICERNANYDGYYTSDSPEVLRQKALSILDQYRPDEVKLVRLDDYYVPELKVGDVLKGKDSGYFLSANIKTDKDGDTIVVLYVGHKNSDKKAQFFIKPEKLQLSTDYKDLDPSKVLAKIELTLKDRIIAQEYGK